MRSIKLLPMLGQSGRQAAFRALVRSVHGCDVCSGMAHCHALGPANGPLRARALFVAEAPGRRGAALTGVPLSGDEAGRRFERFLSLAALRRDEVFVTNAVLCNPRDTEGRNRAPRPAEVARCLPFLERTLNLIEAPVVVALGRTALAALHRIAPHDAALDPPGVPVPWRGRALVALYHPGRRSTLHRADALQDEDWRRLGGIVRRSHARPALRSLASPATATLLP
jgi:uracil-DNA glycosylase family 4